LLAHGGVHFEGKPSHFTRQLPLPDEVWDIILEFLHEWGETVHYQVTVDGPEHARVEWRLPPPRVGRAAAQQRAAIVRWNERAREHEYAYLREHRVVPPTAFYLEPPLNVLRYELEAFRDALPFAWHTHPDTFIDPRTSAAIRRVATAPVAPQIDIPVGWGRSGGLASTPAQGGWVEKWCAYGLGAGQHQIHEWHPRAFLVLLCIHCPDAYEPGERARSVLDARAPLGGFSWSERRTLGVLIISAMARSDIRGDLSSVMDGVAGARHAKRTFGEPLWPEPFLVPAWIQRPAITWAGENGWVCLAGIRGLEVEWGEGGRTFPWYLARSFRERAVDWAWAWEYVHSTM
jgi:hypothetical protein